MIPANNWAHRRRERLDGFDHLLMEAEGRSVFDVGCLRGLVGYEFARWGASKIHGIDKESAAIMVARMLFHDVDGCESKFETVDLAHGFNAISDFDVSYDFVIFLGVYHKLKRSMDDESLRHLVHEIGSMAQRYFVWNGSDGFATEMDRSLVATGLRRDTTTLLGATRGTTIAWKRDR